MTDGYEIPESWGTPPDITKKLSEFMNQKQYAPEDDLQEAIDDMARDIATLEPNPFDWGGWVIYF